jgi:hypothetical protein
MVAMEKNAGNDLMTLDRNPPRRGIAMKSPVKQNDGRFWPAFLPEIEKAINAALKAVAAQEEALAALTPPDSVTAGQRFESIRDRIFGLKTCVDRPGQAVGEVDSLLQISESEVRAYLQEVEGLRQRLADWAGRAIG